MILNVLDENGNYVPIPAIVGPQGPQGPIGPAYTLTAEDKTAIANEVLAALPYGDEVSY